MTKIRVNLGENWNWERVRRSLRNGENPITNLNLRIRAKNKRSNLYPSRENTKVERREKGGQKWAAVAQAKYRSIRPLRTPGGVSVIFTRIEDTEGATDSQYEFPLKLREGNLRNFHSVSLDAGLTAIKNLSLWQSLDWGDWKCIRHVNHGSDVIGDILSCLFRVGSLPHTASTPQPFVTKAVFVLGVLRISPRCRHVWASPVPFPPIFLAALIGFILSPDNPIPSCRLPLRSLCVHTIGKSLIPCLEGIVLLTSSILWQIYPWSSLSVENENLTANLENFVFQFLHLD